MDLVQGADGIWGVVLKRPDGAVETGFTEDADLAGAVWIGGDQESLVTPTLTWIDADAGSLKLEISAAQSASLSPGRYYVKISVTASGKTSTLVSGQNTLEWLDIAAAPGEAEPLRSYISLDDLTLIDPPVEILELAGRDLTKFTRQGWAASRWLDGVVIDRARNTLALQLERHDAVTWVEGSTISAGVDAGPGWGPSIYADADVDAQLTTIQTALDDDGLIIDDSPSGVQARMIAASYALYLILRYQVGQTNQTPYQVLANGFHRAANRSLVSWDARVDLGEDAEPRYLVLRS